MSKHLRWFEYGLGDEPVPTDELMNTIRFRVDWPTKPITVERIMNVLRWEDMAVTGFYSNGDNSNNPILSESNLMYTVAQRLAGYKFESEEDERQERESLAGLYVIFSVAKNDAEAIARVDKLVDDIETVVCESTGLPRSKRPKDDPDGGDGSFPPPRPR